MRDVLIILLALLFQAALAITTSHTYTLDSIICVTASITFLIYTAAIKPKIISRHMFNYFWATFIFGGIGMLVGHSIDMHHTTMGGMHMTFSSLFINWMTLLMLVFCIPVCFFSITPPFKNKPTHNNLHTLLAHLVPVIFMMLGMYIGHMLGMLLRLNMLYSYYLSVFTMSLLHVMGYVFIHQRYSRHLFTHTGVVK